MNKSKWGILVFVFILVACSSTAPTPVSIPTLALEPTLTPISIPTLALEPTLTPVPMVTATPTSIPLVDLEGVLFFDYNGSGLREGDEPGISKFQVCAKSDTCVTTDENGYYIFNNIAPEGTNISLTFVDPNAKNPALAYRYISSWKAKIVLEAYEINGIQVPEQHLNNTDVIPIKKGIGTKAGNKDSIGFTQGFLILPYKCEVQPPAYVSTFYDLDSASGKVRNFTGNTTLRNCNRNVVIEGTCDSHLAIDYIMPSGTPIVATAPGKVNYADSLPPNGALQVTLDHFIGGERYQTGYGHLSKILVSVGDSISRGQVIGLSGKTGVTGIHPPSQIEHLHFAFFDGLSGWASDPHSVDPYRDLTNPSSENWWIKDNAPQCIP